MGSKENSPPPPPSLVDVARVWARCGRAGLLPHYCSSLQLGPVAGRALSDIIARVPSVSVSLRERERERGGGGGA